MKYTKREFEKLLKDKLMSECNVTIDAAILCLKAGDAVILREIGRAHV